MLVIRNVPANAANVKDTSSIPGWGRAPGKGNGNTLPYYCLDNPMDRGARQATLMRSQRVRQD